MPNSDPAPQHARPQWGGLRLGLILFSIALLLGATWLAWRQQALGDPLQRPRPWTSWQWWHDPVEENSLQRLNYVSTRALFSVFFLPDGQHGWTAGYGGIIAATVDGGKSWYRQKTPVTSRLEGICFPEPLKGWAVGWTEGGDGVILFSTDGGKTWSKYEASVYKPLHSVHFIDAKNGWAAGDQGSILRTKDGGTTWQETQPDTTKPALHSVYFTDPEHGWVVGEAGTVARWNNESSTWDFLSPSPQPQKTLYTVHFIDSLRGSAVGDTGTILGTVDGGKTWLAQHNPSSSILIAVSFSDARRGWAVGGNGTILVTEDGGQNWTSRSVASSGALEDVFFVNASRGWAVGDGGLILSTRDGGSTWVVQTSPQPPWLHGIHFPNSSDGWAVGDSGIVLATKNTGRSWTVQASQTRNKLNDAYFVDALHGWVVGEKGIILNTADGGLTWHQQNKTEEDLQAVTFSDLNRGWIAGDGGTILTTENGGSAWSQVGKGKTNEALRCIHVTHPQEVWVVTAKGTQLSTSDAGTTWNAHNATPPPQPLIGLYCNQLPRLWGVTSDGRILETQGGTRPWEDKRAPNTQMLFNIDFADDTHGWAVGAGGTILATTDGGLSWQAQDAKNGQVLMAVRFTDAENGWAVGSQGAVISTSNGGRDWRTLPLNADVASSAGTPSVWFFTDSLHGTWIGTNSRYQTLDGGAHWSAVGSYQRRFAPWWWLVAVACLGLSALAAAIDPGSIRQPPSVEGALAPDVPITSANQDQLGYARIADGLAGFITNSRTAPPLSISITGPWGQGKSSIMELLRRQLETWHFPVVWFNAWHHQQTEDILASLFAHIRDQALPSWTTLRGWAFRMRLAGIRLARRPVLVTGLLLVLSFLLSFIWTNPVGFVQLLQKEEKTVTDFLNPKTPPPTSSNVKSQTEQTEKFVLEDTRSSTASAADPNQALPLVPRLIAVVVAVCALVALLVRLFKAFGVSARSLLPRITDTLRPASLRSPPGARYRFANDFGDVCAAYGVRRLVVFIDDIDRCEAAVVPEVLALVNFLMSSGRCFVVLGAEKSWVQAAIAYAYKDISETLKETSQDSDSATPRIFARRYLEKLLNLEIPVTASGDNIVREMLKARESKTESNTTHFDATWIEGAIKQGWPFVAVAIMTVAAAWVGTVAGRQEQSQPGRPYPMTVSTNVTSPISCSTGNPCKAAEKSTPGGAASAVEADTWVIPAAFRSSRFPWLPPLGCLFVVGILGFLASLRVPRFIREDSPNFQKALGVWADWLSYRHRTPRSFKRFVNKVRFLAMLQRGDAARVEGWVVRIWRSLFRKAPAAAQMDNDLWSPAMVAYAAILTRQKKWRGNVLTTAFPADGRPGELTPLKATFEPLNDESFDAVYAELSRAVAEHGRVCSVKADPHWDTWLPEEAMQRLIESIVIPEAG